MAFAEAWSHTHNTASRRDIAPSLSHDRQGVGGLGLDLEAPSLFFLSCFFFFGDEMRSIRMA